MNESSSKYSLKMNERYLTFQYQIKMNESSTNYSLKMNERNLTSKQLIKSNYWHLKDDPDFLYQNPAHNRKCLFCNTSLPGQKGECYYVKYKISFGLQIKVFRTLYPKENVECRLLSVPFLISSSQPSWIDLENVYEQ